jgi:hypothetical protein
MELTGAPTSYIDLGNPEEAWEMLVTCINKKFLVTASSIAKANATT